jgi:hypothetical protein
MIKPKIISRDQRPAPLNVGGFMISVRQTIVP